MRPLWYAIACIAIPSVWAIVMFHAFGYWDRRRAGSGRAAAEPAEHIDYVI